MSKRTGTFTPYPDHTSLLSAVLLANNDLSGAEKLFILSLFIHMNYQDANFTITITHKELMRRMNCSEPTIRRIKKLLQQKNLIAWDNGTGHDACTYYINLPLLYKDATINYLEHYMITGKTANIFNNQASSEISSK